MQTMRDTEIASHAVASLVTTMVIALVDDQAAVRVETERVEENRYLIRVRTASNDCGKVIGKQGRTARAMRTILAAYAMREGLQISLDIVEDANSLVDKPLTLQHQQ